MHFNICIKGIDILHQLIILGKGNKHKLTCCLSGIVCTQQSDIRRWKCMANFAHGDMHILKTATSVSPKLCSINKSTMHLHFRLPQTCVSCPCPFVFKVIASFSIDYNCFINGLSVFTAVSGEPPELYIDHVRSNVAAVMKGSLPATFQDSTPMQLVISEFLQF